MQKLLLGALSLLFGFYLAGSLSTIFGAAAFWEPVDALGVALVTERISREYYKRDREERSTTLELCAAPRAQARRSGALLHLTPCTSSGRLNAVKVGLYFGFVLDALKLAG